MSDTKDGSRRRDRSRKQRGRDARNQNSQSRRENVPVAAATRPKSEPRPNDRPEKQERKPMFRPEFVPPPRMPTPECAKCGKPIQDISSALADKASGSPVHFDCVVTFLQNSEHLAQDQKIVYIGHGRFAVVHFPNPVDTRNFQIIRVIEWENREQRAEWRTEIASHYSQIR